MRKFSVRKITHAIAIAIACAAAARCTDSPNSANSGDNDARMVRRVALVTADVVNAQLDAEWLTDSTVLVMGADGLTVDIVNWRGSSVHVGQQGNGPGEIRGVRSFAVEPGGGFVVFDGGSHRASFWTQNGNFRRQFPLEGLALFNNAWTTDSGIVLHTYSPMRPGALLVRIDSIATPELLAMRQIATEPTAENSTCQLCRMGVGHDMSMAFVVFNDTLYKLLRASPSGNGLPSIERQGVPLVKLTAAEMDSAKQHMQKAYDDGLAIITKNNRDGAAVTKALTKAFQDQPARTHKFRFSGAPLFDRDGSLWIQRFTASGAPAELDVFDRAGKFTRTVKLPEGSRVTRVRGNRLLVLRDIDGVEPVLEEYEVRS